LSGETLQTTGHVEFCNNNNPLSVTFLDYWFMKLGGVGSPDMSLAIYQSTCRNL